MSERPQWRPRVSWFAAAVAVGLALWLGVFAAAERAFALWSRVEQGGTGHSQSGSWTEVSDVNASGGTYRWSQTSTAWAEYTCAACDSLRWVSRRYSAGGIAEVLVDGASQGNIDTYNAANSYQWIAYEVTGLSYGAHTLRVRPTNTKNAASSATTVWLDAWEWEGTAPTTTTTTAPPTTTTTTLPTTTTSATTCRYTEDAPCVVALGSHEATVGMQAIGGFVMGLATGTGVLWSLRHLRGV